MQYNCQNLMKDCMTIAVRDLESGGAGRIQKQDIIEVMKSHSETCSDYALRKMLKEARGAGFLSLWGNHYRIRPDFISGLHAQCEQFLEKFHEATKRGQQTGAGVL